jgi:hypothetical protein
VLERAHLALEQLQVDPVDLSAMIRFVLPALKSRQLGVSELVLGGKRCEQLAQVFGIAELRAQLFELGVVTAEPAQRRPSASYRRPAGSRVYSSYPAGTVGNRADRLEVGDRYGLARVR